MEVLKELLKGENRVVYSKGREGHMPMLFSGFANGEKGKKGRKYNVCPCLDKSFACLWLKSCFPIATLLIITIWVKIRLFCHTQTGPGIGIGNGQSDNPYNDPDFDMHR